MPKHNTSARELFAAAVVFPFDCFGSSGTAEGALLLGDALDEVIEDTRLESKPVRQKVFAERMAVHHAEFNTPDRLANWRATGRELYQDNSEDFLLWLSGNHLGVLPVYDQLDANTLVIQFDAHLDCYDLHDTTTELCHGNFMMHIDGERPRIVNIGHRDLFLPREAIEKHFHKAFAIDGPWQTVTHDADSIWIDIDVDVFDPMLVPAVRQPQPAGLTPREMLGVLNRLDWSKVKGVSFSEFDPKLDVRDASLNLLGWLMEWVLLKRVE